MASIFSDQRTPQAIEQKDSSRDDLSNLIQLVAIQNQNDLLAAAKEHMAEKDIKGLLPKNYNPLSNDEFLKLLKAIHPSIDKKAYNEIYNRFSKNPSKIEYILREVYKGQIELLEVLQSHQWEPSIETLLILCEHHQTNNLPTEDDKTQLLPERYAQNCFLSLLAVVSDLCKYEQEALATYFQTGLFSHSKKPNIDTLSNLNKEAVSPTIDQLIQEALFQNYSYAVIKVASQQTVGLVAYTKDGQIDIECIIPSFEGTYLIEAQIRRVINEYDNQKSSRVVRNNLTFSQLNANKDESFEALSLSLYTTLLKQRIQWDSNLFLTSSIRDTRDAFFERLTSSDTLYKLYNALSNDHISGIDAYRNLCNENPNILRTLKTQNDRYWLDKINIDRLKSLYHQLLTTEENSIPYNRTEKIIIAIGVLSIIAGITINLPLLALVGSSATATSVSQQVSKEDLIKLKDRLYNYSSKAIPQMISTKKG